MANALVGIGIRIEAGPGGPETDRWVLHAEVGPGVDLLDADAMALALVDLLGAHVDDIAQALRNLTIHHSSTGFRHAPEVVLTKRTGRPVKATRSALRLHRSDRVQAT